MTQDEQLLSTSKDYQGLDTIAKGGVINMVGWFAFLLFGYVFQFIIARALGPSDVGIINLSITIVTLVLLFALFGLDQAIVRFIGHYIGVEDPTHESGVIKSAIGSFFLIALILTPLFWFASEYIGIRVFKEPGLVPVMKILTLWLPLTGFVRLFLAVAQSYKQVEYKVIVEQIGIPLVKIAGTLILFWIVGFQTTSVAYAILFSSIIGFGFSILVARRFYESHKSEEKVALINRDLLLFAWPIMLTGFITRTSVQTETLVLGGLTSSYQVGIYSISFKITVLITAFLNALNIIFAPIISELYAKGSMERLAFQFKTVTRWAFTLALPVTLIMIEAAPECLAVFGPEFVPGARILQVLALSQLVFVITGPVGLMLSMTKYPHINMFNALIALIVSVSLSFLLIPEYGAMGAAVAGGITISLINLMRIIEVYVIFHIHPYGWNYLKPLVAGLVAMVVGLAMSIFSEEYFYLFRLIILSAAIFGTYFVIIYVLGWDKADREVFLIMQKKLTSIHRFKRVKF